MADGADVNAIEKSNGKVCFKYTPLHYATIEDHRDIAELLIAKGADLNAKDMMEYTPMHIAARGGHKEIAELLIAKGADVKCAVGSTPLHYAALLNHKEIAELLISEGSDVNAKDVKGITPLDAAIIRKGSEIANNCFSSIYPIL